MAIKEANNTIVINHAVDPVILSPKSRDDGKGIEEFEFPDSSLAASHVFYKRDFGRAVASDGMVSQKGKFSVVREVVTAAGKRRTLVQTLNLAVNADVTAADTEEDIKHLAQFMLDNAADLASGKYSS